MRILGVLSVVSLCAAPHAVFAAPGVATTKTTACAIQADKKDLTGHARSTFLKTCKQGALAPTTPTLGASASRSSQVVTAPSGADRDTRSEQCTAEALRRHLNENQAKEFRLNCLATAAPVRAAGTSTQTPKPSPAKAGLDTLPKPQ